MLIQDIINKIAEVTGLQPVVKGGNRANPLEYMWYRTGQYTYNLEIWLHGNDLLDIQQLCDIISDNINDFADYGKFNGSIRQYGGGSTADQNMISMVMYFQVVDYSSTSSSRKKGGFHFPFSFPDHF